MPANLPVLLTDLAAETVALLVPLAKADWQRPSRAPGWTIADQVSHLAYFDEVAITLATDAGAFADMLTAANAGGDVNPETVAAQYRDRTGAQLFGWFDEARNKLSSPGWTRPRVPWFGPAR